MTYAYGRRPTLFAMALLMLLPVGSAVAQGADLLNEVSPNAGFSSVSRAYPDMDARYARTGTRRDIAQVRRVAVGQSRSDLQAVLGRPAIRNGDGSSEFHLSLPLTGGDRLICQYRVFFDGQDTVERAVWRRPQCADLITGRQH